MTIERSYLEQNNEIKLTSFVGRGGSGKDSQTNLLLPYYPHSKNISTGTVIEESKNPQSYYGLRFHNDFLPYFEQKDRGVVLPDELMVDVVQRIIREESGFDRYVSKMDEIVLAYFFPGFPRTVAQDQALDDDITALIEEAGYSVKRTMFYLDLPRELSFQRAAYRLEQALIEGKPPRRDDQPEVVTRRNKEFDEITMKLVEKKLEDGTIHRIDANQDIETIHQDVKEILGLGSERFINIHLSSYNNNVPKGIYY